jgi:hypothetical protein
MRMRGSKVLVGSSLLAIAVAVMLAPPFRVSAATGSSKSDMPAGPAWKIDGELEESCSCDAACPCWFGNKPTKMNCSGSQAIFIKKGTYGKTSLDGLAMGGMAQSPDGKSMMESFGNFNFNYLYIDQKANPDQRKALEAIAASVFGALAPPEKSKIQYVSITRTVNGAEHTVTFGTIGSFSGHLMTGGWGGPPKIVNPMLPDPIHKEYMQGTTTNQTYNDAAKWQFANSNYMYNSFSVTDKDYAEMMKKMESMPKQ